ncbi:MAG TPA: phosphate acyltransferase PlsX [Thermoanaerobaculia bacterium]|nr:phosphate acyltransferase PlsX [Thermoanaerobaculia bacterium]
MSSGDAGPVSKGPSRVAVDAMGGDRAPGEVVRGVLEAAAEFPVFVYLVGREAEVRREVELASGSIPSNVEIVDATEVVEMHDHPLAPIRKKKNSSIRVCADLVGAGKADAFVSAGNTGAAWTSARTVLGMIEGVDRPALAAVVPHHDGHTVLLDVGANVDSKPHHLREFSVMGHFYAQMLFNLRSPRIGLLSIGEEEGKGNELTRQTFRVMKETGLNFIGNAEGRDVYNGNADVVVCDGFIGNVVLKASEALAEMVGRLLREELRANPLRQVGALLASGAFSALKRRTDYSEYGGAPLLGVRGGCVVCHGRSSAKAIKNAVRGAGDFAASRINDKIHAKVNELHQKELAEGLQAGNGESGDEVALP